MDMGEVGTYTLLERADDPDAGGLMQTPENLDLPPSWLVYIVTDDVDSTVARAEELAGSAIQEAMDVPTVGRMAVLRDPAGASFRAFKPTATN
jgi:predicted enzyme related to lactoylglutathione lyase